MIAPGRLIAELERLDVHFVIGDNPTLESDTLSPAELLAGLAMHTDARMRLAIIAVLLQRPDLAEDIPRALDMGNQDDQTSLKLYYTAVYLLQNIYQDRFFELLGTVATLPDLFSKDLNIAESVSPTIRIRDLALRHSKKSGLSANWFGTYNHTAMRVITHLENEREWARV